MKRLLLLAIVLSAGILFANPAHARINGRKSAVQPQPNAITMMAVSMKVFVAATQKPVVIVGKSLTAILKQVLLGGTKKEGLRVAKLYRPKI